jgi:peroxiredoxin Q/BCP
MRRWSLALTVAVCACGKEAGPPHGEELLATLGPDADLSVFAAPVNAELEVGKPAPAFDVTAHDGVRLESRALAGKHVVVYFYPKDETPGCTTEACSFRDAFDAISKKAVLVGVSADDGASHKAFAEHHKLPFHLVTDTDGSLAKKFGVPFATVHKRQTIVIGPDGNVAKIYRTVDVTKHADEIRADVGAAASPSTTATTTATTTAATATTNAPTTKNGQSCKQASDCGPNDVCAKVAYVAPWDHMCRMKCDAKTQCPPPGGAASGRCTDGLCAVSGPGN